MPKPETRKQCSHKYGARVTGQVGWNWHDEPALLTGGIQFSGFLCQILSISMCKSTRTHWHWMGLIGSCGQKSAQIVVTNYMFGTECGGRPRCSRADACEVSDCSTKANGQNREHRASKAAQAPMYAEWICNKLFFLPSFFATIARIILSGSMLFVRYSILVGCWKYSNKKWCTKVLIAAAARPYRVLFRLTQPKLLLDPRDATHSRWRTRSGKNDIAQEPNIAANGDVLFRAHKELKQSNGIESN